MRSLQRVIATRSLYAFFAMFNLSSASKLLRRAIMCIFLNVSVAESFSLARFAFSATESAEDSVVTVVGSREKDHEKRMTRGIKVFQAKINCLSCDFSGAKNCMARQRGSLALS